jgi:hypothetical protein
VLPSYAKFLVSSAIGFLTMVVIHYWKGLYWNHAFIIGVAGAGLCYWTLRAIENLRRL